MVSCIEAFSANDDCISSRSRAFSSSKNLARNRICKSKSKHKYTKPIYLLCKQLINSLHSVTSMEYLPSIRYELIEYRIPIIVNVFIFSMYSPQQCLKITDVFENSVTRQVNFNKTKMGRNAIFWVIFKHCVPVAKCNTFFKMHIVLL